MSLLTIYIDYLADTVTTLHTTTESTFERVAAISTVGKCCSYFMQFKYLLCKLTYQRFLFAFLV